MTDLARGSAPTPPRGPTQAPGDKQFVLDGPPVARPIGVVNWRGLWTLYVREITRFYKVGTQTL
ncbi:MAG: hypothetical protein O7G13_03385, partial [Alphaproteobacteria bacterium]|nr:hypothetical protein [Alphaproteobacteria bacterium]